MSKAQQRYCDCEKPEWDKGRNICINCEGVPINLRDVLHQFAINYRVESRKTRNEDIDVVLASIYKIVEQAENDGFLVITDMEEVNKIFGRSK